MSLITFSKFHGLGNDFVIVDARGTGDLISAAQAKAVCDRNRGIGADGVLTLLPSRTGEAALRLHIWNADGSVAQMCGNGLRCVVAFLSQDEVILDTDAGLRSGRCLANGQISVSLGKPKLIPEPCEISIEDHLFTGLRVDMGNPHYVLKPHHAADELLDLAQQYGGALERHSSFPDRSNIEFLAWRGDRLQLVVHERGVGITQACGTGAGASYVAAREWGLFESGSDLWIDLLGGALQVCEADGEIFIIGEATEVFGGTSSLLDVSIVI